MQWEWRACGMGYPVLWSLNDDTRQHSASSLFGAATISHPVNVEIDQPIKLKLP